MTIQYTPGKGEITKFLLQSWKGYNIDIGNICSGFSYYENIFSSSTSLTASIVDGTSLINTLPIVGGESLNIVASSPGDAKKLDLKMFLYKIDGRRRNRADVETYNTYCTTREMMVDQTQLVDKAYSGQISEIVKKIFDEYIAPVSGKKLVTVEETMGLFEFIAPKISPFTVLQYLTNEAQSAEHPNSNYIFFENHDGYHFVTIDQLYDSTKTIKLVYDEQLNSAADGASQVLSTHIVQINHDDSVDLLGGQIQGQFSNRTISYDPLSKSMDASVYTYNTEKNSKGNYTTISLDTYDTIASIPTREKFVITNGHRSQLNYIKSNEPSATQIFRRRQDTASQGLAVMKQFGSNRIHIRIPGNPIIRAGGVLDVIIPRPDNTIQGKRLNDRFISGKYLVTAVSQTIDTKSSEYSTVIECMRKSYQESI